MTYSAWQEIRLMSITEECRMDIFADIGKKSYIYDSI